MADDLEDRSWARLGVAAALGREYAAEGKTFLEFLARLLRGAIPEETQVSTRGLFKKSVQGVTVDLGAVRYAIQDSGKGPLAASRAQVVRGIALKTEAISVEECLKELEEVLERRANENALARAALASMLGLE